MKKTVLAILLFVLLIMTSCVSTDAVSQITPLNLYSKRMFASDNQVFFVGEGQADTIRQAELLSYMDLFNKVYNYLGIEPEPEAYRELSTLGTISRYNLKIQEKTPYSENGITYALIASADRELLARDRSTDMVKEEEIASRVVDLVLQGDEYIKTNNDIEGLRCYLKSLALSYGLQYVDDEFSFSAILEEVLHILDVIKIDISKPDSSAASCTLSVRRHDSLIPSRVKNGILKATFKSEDSRGQVFDDFFMYTTNAKGVIEFVPRAYNIQKKGTVYFAMDFKDEINAIRSLSPSTADAIEDLIRAKTVSFDYNTKVDEELVTVCAQCVDRNGLTIENPWVDDFIIDKYAESNINAVSFDYDEDETVEELLQRFGTNGKSDSLILFRVGVSDVFETRMNVCSVSVEGTVVVYDVKNNTVIYDSGITYANGFGTTVEEAQNDAFRNYVLMMFTLLKAYYV